MADIGRAFVTIVPKADGISNKIANLVDPGVATAGKSAGRTLTSSIGDGVVKAGNTLTRFVASGAATVAGLAGAISTKTFGGGFARAMQIDNARAKMNQLGMETDKIMQNVNDSVSGTRFGLNEMAGIAVNFASANVAAGTDMTNALKSVASAASIAGIDLNHMGAIYTKVASAGKVTGQVMTQLSYNGINANAALQKHFGKSQEEISKMVSQGKIDFKEFSDAMYEYFGDAALSANSTFSGALANVGAAMSRIGAKFADPLQKRLRDIFAGTDLKAKGGLMLAFDNIAKALDSNVIPAFTAFVDKIGGGVVGALNTFNDAMANGASVMDAFKQALSDLIPDSIVSKFNALPEPVKNVLSFLGKGAGIVAGVAASFGVLGGAVGSLVPGLGGLIGPLLGSGGAFKLVSGVGKTLFGVIGSLLGGGGIGGLGGALGGLVGPLGIVAALFGGAMAKSEEMQAAVSALVSEVGGALEPVISGLSGAFKSLMPTISTICTELGSTLASSIAYLVPVIGEAVSAVVEFATSIGTALKPVISALLPVIQQLIPIIANVINIVLSTVVPVIQQLTPVISQIIQSVGMLVANVASALLPVIQEIITWVQKILAVVVPIVTTIVNFVLTGVNGLIQAITPIISGIVTFIGTTLSTMRQSVSNILNAVKSTFTSVWNFIKGFVTGAVNAIKTVIGTFTEIPGKVRSAFNAVKEAITKPIDKAKELIQKAIDKIKSIFPVSLGKICNLKIPKISVSAGSPPWGIGGKGKKPDFSVSWAAQGGIVDGATLIGAGEKGAEAIVPLDPFWNKLEDSLQARNEERYAERQEALLIRILNRLDYIADQDTSIKWNSREVGRLIHEVM